MHAVGRSTGRPAPASHVQRIFMVIISRQEAGGALDCRVGHMGTCAWYQLTCTCRGCNMTCCGACLLATTPCSPGSFWSFPKLMALRNPLLRAPAGPCSPPNPAQNRKSWMQARKVQYACREEWRLLGGAVLGESTQRSMHDWDAMLAAPPPPPLVAFHLPLSAP